jgi:hypothetical protein
MTTILNASPSNGLVQTADGSGVIKVQSNGVTTNALAWVNFNGTSGTRNASYNVSSVTRNSLGNYTITFANALSDANYCISQTMFAQSSTNDGGVAVIAWGTTPTTTSFNMVTDQRSAGEYDPAIVCFTVHGN